MCIVCVFWSFISITVLCMFIAIIGIGFFVRGKECNILFCIVRLTALLYCCVSVIIPGDIITVYITVG